MRRHESRERATQWRQTTFLRHLMVHDLRHARAIGHLSTLLVVNVIVLFEELLERLVRLQVVLAQPEYLERLQLCHETTLDAKALFSDLLAALVSEFFGEALLTFLRDEALDFLLTFE